MAQTARKLEFDSYCLGKCQCDWGNQRLVNSSRQGLVDDTKATLVELVYWDFIFVPRYVNCFACRPLFAIQMDSSSSFPSHIWSNYQKNDTDGIHLTFWFEHFQNLLRNPDYIWMKHQTLHPT